MADTSFQEFCEKTSLEPKTIKLLLEKGFQNSLSLADLTDDDIDREFPELIFAQRLRLKRVVKELQSGEAVTTRSLIKRRYCTFLEKDSIRLVLMGITGAGKSATANTIYGCDEFPSEAGISSTTRTCSGKTVRLDDIPVLLVDTPGVCDTEMKREEVIREVTRCLTYCDSGPHCFIMTIKHGRFTDEEKHAYLMLKAMFGDHVQNYMILLITGGDTMKTDYIQTLKQKNTDDLGQSEKSIKAILSDVGNRYIIFNNKADIEAKDRQVRALLKMITNLMATHSPNYFRSELIDKVKRAFDLQVQELAQKEKIDIEEARRIFIEELNNNNNMDILAGIAATAGVGACIAAAAGLTLASGGAFAVAATAGAGALYYKGCSLM